MSILEAMKTIGLLGGMSWESTQTYYRLINEGVKGRLGGLHSARIAMFSVDFAPIETMQCADEWEAAGRMLAEAAARVEAAGADFLVICSNTMHRVAPAVEASTRIPLLHIADATAAEILAAEIGTVGLLGTRFTMEGDFYRGRLVERHGLEVLIPGDADRELVNRVIYEELCLGQLRDDSRKQYVRIIGSLAERGAGAVILGCTEISLLVTLEDSPIRLFDTAEIHARAAVERALEPNPPR